MTTWFITGAGRGLGLEIARAALAGGEDVVVGARRPGSVPADVAGSPRVLTVPLDVTDPDAVAAAVTAATERFGGIDVLVNNAGRGLMGAVEEVGDDEARALFEVNVFGLLTVTRAVLPVMRAAGRGTIVNLSSIGGLVGLAATGLYNATKFAVEGITEALATEVGAFGIRCVAVEPGVFRTDFLDPSSMVVARNLLPAYEGTPARERVDGVGGRNHRQAGDPAKAAALIYEVVSGDDVPGHLPLGADALDVVARKVEALAADADRWRAKSVATGHDDTP